MKPRREFVFRGGDCDGLVLCTRDAATALVVVVPRPGLRVTYTRQADDPAFPHRFAYGAPRPGTPEEIADRHNTVLFLQDRDPPPVETGP